MGESVSLVLARVEVMCVTSRTKQSTTCCANLAWFPSATGTSQVQDAGYSASRSPTDWWMWETKLCSINHQDLGIVTRLFWRISLSLNFVPSHMLFLLLEICMHPPFSPWQFLTDTPSRPSSKVFLFPQVFSDTSRPFLFYASPVLSLQTSIIASITFYSCYLFT